MQSLSGRVPVSFLCQAFSVSRSAYYLWKQKRSVVSKRQGVCEAIRAAFLKSKRLYGSPRIYADLKGTPHEVSLNTVAKYMNKMRLLARIRKRRQLYNQSPDSSLSSVAPRVFKTEKKACFPARPGEVLAGDITYLPLSTGFMYLAVVMDLCTREVIGWSLGKSQQTSLALSALVQAIKTIKKPETKIIFHSDRGPQYLSAAYQHFLQLQKIVPSMSRRGNCYDNAFVESWFASFKKECLYRSSYENEKDLRQLAFQYIEIWYNRKRKHSALDYKTPYEYKMCFG